MEKEFNAELKETISKRFEDLFKEIGPNRQQLSTKVSMAYRDINKELSREKVDDKRSGEILLEVTKIEKMAAQQLPHHLRRPEGSAASEKQASTAIKKEPKKVVKKEEAPTVKKEIKKEVAPAAKKEENKQVAAKRAPSKKSVPSKPAKKKK